MGEVFGPFLNIHVTVYWLKCGESVAPHVRDGVPHKWIRLPSSNLKYV